MQIRKFYESDGDNDGGGFFSHKDTNPYKPLVVEGGDVVVTHEYVEKQFDSLYTSITIFDKKSWIEGFETAVQTKTKWLNPSKVSVGAEKLHNQYKEETGHNISYQYWIPYYQWLESKVLANRFI